MASASIRGAIEILLLALVCLSPWGFGGFEPVFEFLLDLGLFLLLALWGLLMIVQGRLTWVKCPVALCLACLFWFGVCQLVPLHHDLLERISPATAHLYQALLPAQPEQLPDDDPATPPTLVAGTTLSVYPGKTRQELFRLLAVVLAFALVRNTIASPASLERFFLVLVVNGTLLAFFAIVQFFSSPPGMIYWSVQTPGTVFGPFISRTHFPFYVNVCIGAAIGLLIALRQRSGASGWNIAGLVERPAELWLVCAIALMGTSVLFSLSRGGFLALLAGFLALFFLTPGRGSKRAGWVVPALVLTVLGTGLLGWLGLARVEQRLSTLATGEALQSRLPLWRDALRLVPDFGLLGTGWGTFAFVEPLHRTHTAHQIVNEYAHNELLEALVEGGVVRLTLTLVLIGLLSLMAVRAVRRHAGQPTGGLALGGLFGFTTLMIQSVGDFGIHAPAIALLAAVLSAQIVSLARAPLASKRKKDPDPLAAEESYSFRLGRLAPVGGALVLLTLGWLILFEGWRTYRAEGYRDYARTLQKEPDPRAGEVRVNNLEVAVRFAPDHVRLRNDLAKAHLDAYEQRLRWLRNSWAFATTAQIVLAPMTARGDGGLPAPQIALTYRIVSRTSAEQTFPKEIETADRDHLYPALREFALARDVCPLLAQPHIMIASNLGRFQKADSRRAYLERAKMLVTNDPALYFLFGLEDYFDNQIDQACASWRHSLELADTELPIILSVTRKFLQDRDFYDKLLPDEPGVLLAAGVLLKDMHHPADHVRTLWERALQVAQTRHTPPTAIDFELQARILRRLDRPGEAIAAYKDALGLKPRQAEWRYDLAQLLAEQKRYKDARHELSITIGLDPGNAKAQELLKRLARDVIEKR